MATARDVIEAALKDILVQASDAPLEADEYADGLEALNNFMTDQESIGIRLGFTEVANVADTVTVPRGALRGVIANLAIEMAPMFDMPVSPQLTLKAKSGMMTMRRLGRAKIRASLPVTLPRGSGNTADYSGGWNNDFYRPVISAVLSLSGNSQVTTIASADTPVKVAGEWRRVRAEGMSTDVAGRIVNAKAIDGDITATVALSATGSGIYIFRLMHNGISVAVATPTLSAAPVDVTITKFLILKPGDYLELWVEATSHTNSPTINSAQFEVG